MMVKVRRGTRTLEFPRTLEVQTPIKDRPLSTLAGAPRLRPSQNTRVIVYLDDEGQLREFVCSQSEIIRTEQVTRSGKVRRWRRRHG